MDPSHGSDFQRSFVWDVGSSYKVVKFLLIPRCDSRDSDRTTSHSTTSFLSKASELPRAWVSLRHIPTLDLVQPQGPGTLGWGSGQAHDTSSLTQDVNVTWSLTTPYQGAWPLPPALQTQRHIIPCNSIEAPRQAYDDARPQEEELEAQGG